MPIDADLARALGTAPSANRHQAAAALIRQGTGNLDYWLAPGDLDTGVVDFMIGLGEKLATWLWADKAISVETRAPQLARSAARDLVTAGNALPILAVIGPHQTVPSGPAKDMGRVCKALVAQRLPGFVGHVLTEWVDTGQLRRRLSADLRFGPNPGSSTTRRRNQERANPRLRADGTDAPELREVISTALRLIPHCKAS